MFLSNCLVSQSLGKKMQTVRNFLSLSTLRQNLNEALACSGALASRPTACWAASYVVYLSFAI